MLLHEDALKMFLPELKDHLESYQVCLGQIDQWTMKPVDHETTQDFINYQFSLDAKVLNSEQYFSFPIFQILPQLSQRN